MLPAWAVGGATWAPDVRHVQGGWALYFTALLRDVSPPTHCVGAAFGSSATGPFVALDQPFVCQLDHRGTIDPRCRSCSTRGPRQGPARSWTGLVGERKGQQPGCGSGGVVGLRRGQPSPARQNRPGQDQAAASSSRHVSPTSQRSTLRRLIDFIRFLPPYEGPILSGRIDGFAYLIGWIATFAHLALGVGGEPPLIDPVEERPKLPCSSSTSARAAFANHGQRVVEGQRLMQAGADGVVRDHYMRQLWDWKASADIETMRPEGLTLYAQICGWTLDAGRWRGPTPAPATGWRSRPTSATATPSTAPSPTSPPPTPSRTTAITGPRSPSSNKGASKLRPASSGASRRAGPRRWARRPRWPPGRGRAVR
jgi:hypothetical protein